MPARPSIAVVTPSVLTGIGLKAILEKVIPMADVELYATPEGFAEADPARFYHFFVAASLFLSHPTLFAPHRAHTILLCNGAACEACEGMHTLDVDSSEESLVHDIVRMHHHAHRHEHDGALPAEHRPTATLSEREIEVLTLLAHGHINKEIADQLHIGVTTVISHRRNISEKLGIRSVAGLAIYAMRAGYVKAESL